MSNTISTTLHYEIQRVESVIRQRPNSVGANLAKAYVEQSTKALNKDNPKEMIAQIHQLRMVRGGTKA